MKTDHQIAYTKTNPKIAYIKSPPQPVDPAPKPLILMPLIAPSENNTLALMDAKSITTPTMIT